MSNRRQKKGQYKNIMVVLVITVFAIIAYNYFFKFNPQNLVEESELGRKNFSTPVVEIKSPVHNIKAYLFEETTNPIISLSVIFANAGAASDPKDKEGLANLTASMLGEGAGELDSQKFKEELENNAISINFAAGKDDFTASVLTLKENSAKAWELFKLSLTEPRLEKTDLYRIKQNLLAALQSQMENPQTKLSLLAAEKIYGDHPYSRNPLGKKQVIEKIDREDIQEFIKNNLAKNNIVVGIAGDISEQEASLLLDNLFGNLTDQAIVEKPVAAKIDFTKRVDFEEDLPQTVAILAAKGTSRLSADFYPLYIANYIIGGSGLNSRLNQAAREKEGLTYGIYTGLVIYDAAELIMGGASSTPDNFPRLREVILKEWADFGHKGISDAELTEAKNYLISSYNLRFADLTNIADMLVYMQRDNLGIDFLQKRNGYINAVTKQQVNKAAAKYYNPQELIIINLGKFNKQGDNE